MLTIRQNCFTFHASDWWRNHWGKTELVEVDVSDTLENGYKYWAQQGKGVKLSGFNIFSSVEETRLKDEGRYIGFVRMIAKKINAKTDGVTLHP